MDIIGTVEDLLETLETYLTEAAMEEITKVQNNNKNKPMLAKQDETKYDLLNQE